MDTYCRVCGYEFDSIYYYSCPECGAYVSDVTVEEKKLSPIEQMAQQYKKETLQNPKNTIMPQYNDVKFNFNQEEKENPKEKKERILFITTFICLFLIILGMIIFMVAA